MNVNDRLYFDYNATTPVDPRVRAAMEPFFSERFCNPASVYRGAGDAFMAVETARRRVAGLIGADEKGIVFTSGGTEADNLAILGATRARRSRGNHLITSAIEHSAVLQACRHLERSGFEVTFLPVDGEGRVAPEELERAIRPATILVSIMHANNETGVIQPLGELARIASVRGVLFHTDAVQSVGKTEVRADELGIDLLSLSGHKLYAAKGTGALYVRPSVQIEPLVFGGGQEKGFRSGTENIPGIVGLGAAAELAAAGLGEERERIGRLRDRIEKRLEETVPDIRFNGRSEPRLAGTTNVSFRFCEGDALLAYLDQQGVAVSAGSACSARSAELSHVLLAMGLPAADVRSSLRISLGRFTAEEEVDRLLEIVPRTVDRLRGMAPAWR